MDKYSPNSVYENAFIRDKSNNEYTNEALYMATILHAAGGERTETSEREVARLMDDINERSGNGQP